MAGKEKNFENKIKNFLKKENCYFFKFWGTMYTKAGVPDIIACVNGRFVGIEVKSDVGRPSEIQLVNINQIHQCLGFAVVVHPEGFDDLVEMIRAIKEGDIETATKLEGGLQK